MTTTSPRPLTDDDLDAEPTGQPGQGRASRLRARLPQAASAVGRARLTVVPRLRSRAPRVPFVALVSVLMVAGVVGLLLFNTSMQQASFQATRLEAQARSLSAQEQSLTMQLDKLRDPQQLALRAQAQGLVPPATVAFLDVETGQVTGEPSPAVAGDGLRLQEPPPARPADLDPAPAAGQGQGDAQGNGDGQNQNQNQGRNGNQDRDRDQDGGQGRLISPEENPLNPLSTPGRAANGNGNGNGNGTGNGTGTGTGTAAR